MAKHVEGTFEVTSWDEEQAPGREGRRRCRRGYRTGFTWGVEAETLFDAVMTYLDDGSAK